MVGLGSYASETIFYVVTKRLTLIRCINNQTCHQIPTRTLSQKNCKNIIGYYHNSFQDDLVNFLPPLQNVENVIIVEILNV